MLSVCLSVRKEQLGSYGKDFRENWQWSVFQKFVQKIQFSLILKQVTGILCLLDRASS